MDQQQYGPHYSRSNEGSICNSGGIRSRPNVRRRTLFQRVISYPGDTWLKLMTQYQELDWDYVHDQLAIPIALVLNFVYLLCRFFNYISVTDNDYKKTLPAQNLAVLPQIEQPSPSSLDWIVNPLSLYPNSYLINFPPPFLFDIFSSIQWMLSVLGLNQLAFYIIIGLWIISILNSLYLFSRSRRYELIKFDQKNPPKSPNIRLVPAGVQVPIWASSALGHVFWVFIARHIYVIAAHTNEYGSDVLELYTWDISLFHRNFFCLFSPFQLYLLQFIEWDDIHLVPVLILVPVMFHIIMRQYDQLIKDRQIISGSMFYEYNVRLVNPKLLYDRNEKSVGPDDGYINDLVSDNAPSSANIGASISHTNVAEHQSHIQTNAVEPGPFPGLESPVITPYRSPPMGRPVVEIPRHASSSSLSRRVQSSDTPNPFQRR